MATKAFSPPERRESTLRALPGGCTRISMPQLRMSSGSSSSRVALPPPNSSVNTRLKFSLMARKLSVKISRIWAESFAIMRLSSLRLSSTSVT